MSDLMERAIVTMPYDLAMGDELSRMQFWSRVQLVYKEKCARIEADEALMRNLLHLRDNLGWCKEVDDAINALMARLESSNG